MLIAEIHGHYVHEARSSDDYLTSTVFGHLRYIPPGPFWQALLSRAVSLQLGNAVISAAEWIVELSGSPISSFETLDVLFWPTHPLGTPDLVLCFQAASKPAVVMLVEAKLESGKSSSGEDDQLARYLRILDTLADLRPRVPSNAIALLVYLTALDSRTDLIDSIAVYGDSIQARRRLYALQWQDIVEAVDPLREALAPVHRMIAKDVRDFLRVRDLDYFAGMNVSSELPAFSEADGSLFTSDQLLDDVDLPNDIADVKEPWVYGH